jgi:hypothetical protein
MLADGPTARSLGAASACYVPIGDVDRQRPAVDDL